MNYRAYGFTLASAIPFPELPVSDATPDLELSLGPLLSGFGDAPLSWLHEWTFDDGSVGAQLARMSGSDYLLRFPDLLDVGISANGGRLQMAPRKHLTAPKMRHLLLDQALPLAMSLSGSLVLHASGVVLEGIVAFAGPARRGKSTLAAALAATGHAVFSDDGILVNEARGLAVAAYPGIRLWSDVIPAITGETGGQRQDEVTKHRFMPGDGAFRFDAAESWLRRIYLLEPDATAGCAPRVLPLEGAAACVALLGNAYRLDITDRQANALHLQAASQLATQVPCRRLVYPRRLAALPELCARVIEDLAR